MSLPSYSAVIFMVFLLRCCLSVHVSSKQRFERMLSIQSVENKPFSSRKLLDAPKVYFDRESVQKFEKGDALFPLRRKTGVVTTYCRQISFITYARLNKFSNPIVYDAMVTDETTGIRGVVRSENSGEDARDYAISGLTAKLISDGLIRACHVPSFGAHLTSSECKPNSNISCTKSSDAKTCTFQCDKIGYRLIGQSSVACQSDGSLSSELPSCRAVECIIPKLSPNSRSVDEKCGPGYRIPFGTGCVFACDDSYALNGRAVVSCLSDGTLSAELPTCKADSPFWTHRAHDPVMIITGGSTLTPTTFTPIQRNVAGKATTSGASGNHVTSRGSPPRNHKANTYFAFLVVPLVGFILGIVIFPIKRRRTQIHRHIKETEPLFDEECEPFLQENGDMQLEEIPPDIDGYYRNSHIIPATPTLKQLDPEENYLMDSREKGFVFILNNNNFACGRLRKGSEIDVCNIQHIFVEIGYVPVTFKDLTASMVRTALHDLTQRIESKHTSVVLVLMSHGEETGILGVDGCLVTMSEIKAAFSGSKCPALIAKPKIIFVQACRGKRLTRRVGADIAESEDPLDSGKSWPLPSSHNAPVKAKVAVETDCGVPDNADIYIAYATSEGYFSMRDRVNGSWFIQALCEVLLARAHLDDLDTMMTKVTRRVKSREAKIKLQGQYHQTMQTPQTVKQGIGKLIYFLPKYPANESHHIEINEEEY